MNAAERGVIEAAEKWREATDDGDILYGIEAALAAAVDAFRAIQPSAFGEAVRLLDETLLHVTLEEIDRQRELGWPNFHPEDFCHRCGGKNPSWSIDSDRFNTAMGPHENHRWNGIICVGCFVELHEAATGLRCSWSLVPLTHFHHIEAAAVDALVAAGSVAPDNTQP